MAYYIDEERKTAVKAEGKVILGWNHETRRFDLPVQDATPKSHMKRCSDFEARLFLVEKDPSGCFERTRILVKRVDKNLFENDVNALTVESAEAKLKEIEDLRNEALPEVDALQAKVDEYGITMSEPAEILAAYRTLFDKDLEIAHQDIVIAQLKQDLGRAKVGER